MYGIPPAATAGADNAPTVIEDDELRLSRRTTPTPGVGREALLARARFAMDQHNAWIAEWERSGCFAARGLADFWLGKAADAVEAM
jgi:hypothetical protein